MVQVKVCCCQATSNYLGQCWPSSMTPYGTTRPQWINWWSGECYTWQHSIQKCYRVYLCYDMINIPVFSSELHLFVITHPYTCIYEFIRVSFWWVIVKNMSRITCTNKNSHPYLTWWKEAGVTSNQAKVLHWGTMDLTMFLGWPCSETGKK